MSRTLVDSLRARLTPRGRGLLDAEITQPTRPGTWMSIALSCMNAGMDEADFELLGYASVAITTTSRDPGKLLSGAWSAAEVRWKPPEGGSDLARQQLATVDARIRSRPWTGRTGTRDRAVALAVVAYGCDVVGSTQFAVSVRSLELLAGYRYPAISKALIDLRRLGLLKRIGPTSNPRHASEYRVNVGWEEAKSRVERTLHPTATECSVSGTPVFVHPAFLRGALGPSTGRVYYGMTDGTKATEIAAAVGVTPGSAVYNLRKLVDAGLVTRTGHKYARTAVPGLDAIAEQAGTADWIDRTRDRHQREREKQAEKLAEYREHNRTEEAWEAERRASAVDPFSDDDQPYTAGPMPKMSGIPDPFLDAA